MRRLSREQVVQIARLAVAGKHRPTYCKEPAKFFPHEWVADALEVAYKLGEDAAGAEFDGPAPEVVALEPVP